MSSPPLHATHANRWLYGPVPDLLFGCGLLYVGVSLIFAIQGGKIFYAVPIGVTAAAVALVSAPHYGATLLRVYEQREDRRSYFLFSVVATVVLIGLFGLGLVDRWTGSVIATVYLTWAGWHYTAQNYGIAAMFLRRRGIEYDGRPRRALHTSFTLSYALVFLVMHGADTPAADPGVEVRLIPLGIPEALNEWAIPLVIVAYLATTIAWVHWLVRRGASFSDLAPTLTLSGIQALWWSIPYTARFFGWAPDLVPVGWGARDFFFPWIACAHAAQYLWITSFYARSSGGWHGQLRYYVGVLAAGSAVWALPPVLFAPGLAAFDWNFALLVAATVNIHHFILDGAIWKLRNSKVARILIFDGVEEESQRQGSVWLPRAVWAVAAIGLALTLHSLAERLVILPLASRANDLEAIAASLDRQVWHAKTTSHDRFKLGRRFEAQGDAVAAIEQIEISVGMEPRVESIARLLVLYQVTGDAQGFVRSCDRLFALDGIERPMPSPDVRTASGSELETFQVACVRTVHSVLPQTASGLDADGGLRGGDAARARAVYQ